MKEEAEAYLGETVTDGTLDADSKGRSDSWSDFGSEF